MLTNFDLEARAQKYRIPLVGVFSKDKLPSARRPGGYIINMEDERNEFGALNEGSHWVACYLEPPQACYFDSFGCSPPEDVSRFLRPFHPWAWNSTTIQSMNSSVCGAYCLAFLWYMNKHRRVSFNKRFQNFVALFSDKPYHNAGVLERIFRLIK